MWPSDFPGLKWLYPGMRIKRWFFLAVIGMFLVSAGLAGWLPASPRFAVSLVLVVSGLALVAAGLRQVVRSVVEAVRPGQGPADLATAVYARRQKGRGPRVVGIGGGTGMGTLLRGLKEHTDNLTAIVTVADDGGSSGRLRAEMGVLPPGDVRMCLVALADTEPLMERLFQYRFRQAGEGLTGHNFGNLFIAALTAITGDFEEAIKESSKVLAVRGQVLPSTLTNVVLHAELADGRVIAGESEIARARGRVRRVFLTPSAPPALPEALAALAAAEVVVLGPGSLYTSVLPNLLVHGIAEGIRRSPAVKVYVCNVMTQPGETDGYTVSDHVQAILDHAGPGLIDYALVNTLPVPSNLRRKYQEQGAEPVVYDPERLAGMGVTAVTGNLASLTDLVRHDPERLAQAILALLGPKWKGSRRGRLRAGDGRDAGQKGKGQEE
ncbi:MAG: uridine diphosphate-N-acetylglucosamine-binding protein YvcK [Bacillota bacterium]|nr:uridine diphosphate-N-acetylglucosamine-binding protein YvcK [Bacillota bacterium]